MLLQALDTDSIKNVFIYVGDGIRYDFLPDSIANMGVSIKSIAGSIHSPTAFATIVSGLLYPQHGVADFSDQLTTDLPHLFSASSHETAFCNTINHPPFNTNPASDSILATTLNTNDSPSDLIQNIDPPFILMERGPGGHAPYGDFNGNGSEYFRARGDASRDILANEYATAVRNDADWFLSQLSILKERGLDEETLIIYTSDHGELLGEMGTLGHNGLIHRRLVETPCVFIHPSLPNRSVSEDIIRQIDLLPTIIDTANATLDRTEDLPGRKLTREQPATLGASYYRKHIFENSSVVPTLSLAYDSVCDATGGYMIPRSNRLTRMSAALGSLITGPKSKFRRNHVLAAIGGFFAGLRIEGAPQFSLTEARECLSDIESINVQKETTKVDVPEDRLKELGYLE
ncbi:sulfatase-like hydrolase/transferase [Haloarcula argentinensis]|uniref:Sulfatase-like hydrolase/transferase n=1 Tax=Haloarcula argentinensis TaxID=43776 RepID=A0A847ULS4_HALAR|nr:sulfatase-like hydrolase/transferase [Haloarcula argentinensis]NLV12631.1 sulfatase-like hydrolase/transferase [Haloarcula argentinensis]